MKSLDLHPVSQDFISKILITAKTKDENSFKELSFKRMKKLSKFSRMTFKQFSLYPKYIKSTLEKSAKKLD